MNGPRHLTPGAPVGDAECWFRTIVNREHVDKKGMLVIQAFKGRAFAITQIAGFAHELSGQLVSQVGDLKRIDAEDNARVISVQEKWKAQHGKLPSWSQYMGVACASAAELRPHMGPNIRSDVYFTPITGSDEAHSDFVVSAAETELDKVRAELVKRLRVVAPSDVVTRLANCGK